MRTIAILLCYLIINVFNIANINSNIVVTSQVYIQISGASYGNVNLKINNLIHHGSEPSVTSNSNNSNSIAKYERLTAANQTRLTRKAGEMSIKKCMEYYPANPQMQEDYYEGTRRKRTAQNLHNYDYPDFQIRLASTPSPTPSSIWKGEQTFLKEFPHMALIGLIKDTGFDRWICGGSLISHSFVLTAAHCLVSEKLIIRLGELDTSNTTETETQDFGIKKLLPHPNYTSSMHYHDIALIELAKPVTLSQYIGIACLDSPKELDENQILTVTGWGQTRSDGPNNNYLQKVNVYVIPHTTCNKRYKNKNFSMLPFKIIDDTQICAVGLNGKDACKGDSGGPLQVFYKNHGLAPVYNVVGITSFGPSCGYSSENNPGVYTRVHYYLSWIEDIVWP